MTHFHTYSRVFTKASGLMSVTIIINYTWPISCITPNTIAPNWPVDAQLIITILFIISTVLHLEKECTVEPWLSGFLNYLDFSIMISGLFLWSQFGHEYLLVTIKIRSHILFKTTALKGAVKCKGFCSQRAKAALALVGSTEEHLNEFWLD